MSRERYTYSLMSFLRGTQTGITAPEIGRMWLQTAKIARKAGHIQTAYSASLQAVNSGSRFAVTENVKLLRDSGHSLKALQDLDSFLSTTSSNLTPSQSVLEPDYTSKYAKVGDIYLIIAITHMTRRRS